MTIDSSCFSIFSKEYFKQIYSKFGKNLVNTKTKGICPFNRLDIYIYSTNSVSTDNLSVYDIYISEHEWNSKLHLFHGKIKTKNITQFNYFNYFLDKYTINDSSSETSLSDTYKTYKIKDYKITDIPNLSMLCIQNNLEQIDASSFSCKDKYKKSNITEHIIKISDRAPIFLSFIKNENNNTHKIKLWIDINHDIDVVIDEIKLL